MSLKPQPARRTGDPVPPVANLGAHPSEAEDGFRHRPVMVDEVVDLFAPTPAGWALDATVGGGGHARALLEAYPHLRVLGLDRDADAVAAASSALAPFGDRVKVVHQRFDRLDVALDELGIPTVSGALFDLGVSSPQIDRPERGFSYRSDAPLDMRMDRSEAGTAAELLDETSEDELTRLFALHGETRFARRIAAAIVSARPVRTTLALADVVSSAVPAAVRRRGHPAKRVFQALRAAVNAELEVLPVALDAAISRLSPGGRIVVISYHSGEDRATKATFVEAATGGCTCPPGLPCVCGAEPRVRLLNRGARKPSAAEVADNPRSESARLRAVEALAGQVGARTENTGALSDKTKGEWR
jgi:16S rRNA (cytosine1402-N4)-methyltransferase